MVYNQLTIERTEADNKKRYTKDDYQRLEQFYESKVHQIHIVGEYAKKMISDYQEALQFVDDYFQLNYTSFLRKYFPGSKADDLRLRVTPAKFKQLFGELSPRQLKIINDNESKYIVVAAGPGSGKTKVLVHKLASLLLMEDVKHEQLLMLTFSRAAATEFKQRLSQLIGNVANFVEIKTFHSYCFDLLGRVGSLEQSSDIISKTVEKINNKEVEVSRITKTVLVIDEAQDMDINEFNLIRALMLQNEEMRVIAVGDDDQNIYEFRGSSPEFMERMALSAQTKTYELIENYRSKNNLVQFTNQFVKRIPKRLKDTPIMANQSSNGILKLFHYSKDSNLITPLVNDLLSSGISGTSCVLTKTNEEALQVAGLLIERGMPAKLIQSNDYFRLSNLHEVRFFINQLQLTADTFVIADEIWQEAKSAFKRRFHRSNNFEMVSNLIHNFETSNPKQKYKSDLEVFIQESHPEDFILAGGESIIVSTIHKAKGREFDNVYLMLDNINISKDEVVRQLYVAMTRAKENLIIHINSDYLNQITADDLIVKHDSTQYPTPDKLIMQLSLRDVWLDFFLWRQRTISQLMSGDSLDLMEVGCTTQGKPVLKFSLQFLKQIESLTHNNYQIQTAKVNHIVYWQKEDSEEEVLVVLVEVGFGRG